MSFPHVLEPKCQPGPRLHSVNAPLVGLSIDAAATRIVNAAALPSAAHLGRCVRRPQVESAWHRRCWRYLARKLQEPASDRSRQLAGLVAAAVEWGLDDGQVLALALQHRPTRERQQAKGTNIQADVARLLATRQLGCGSQVICSRRLRDWQRPGV